MQNFAALLEKYKGTLHNLSVHNITLKTSGALQFWTDFSGLAARHRGMEEMFLIDRAQHAIRLDQEYSPESDDEEESEEEHHEGDGEMIDGGGGAGAAGEQEDESVEEFKCFLNDEAFVKSILTHYGEKNDELTLRFLCSFFDILLDISPH